MKKNKLFILILGAMSLYNCTPYRIKVTGTPTAAYYQPQRRVGLQWKEHWHSFENQEDALEQIDFWKEDKKYAVASKKIRFINVK